MLVLLLIWFNIHAPHDDETPHDVTPTLSSSQSAAGPAAQLNDMQFDGQGAPWRLSGTVHNISTAAIRAVSLQIERLDCPQPDSARAECRLLWQGIHVLHVNIPVAGSVAIDESFYSHDPVLRLEGMARNLITIASVE
ncbi:MAG: hypothetical protein AB7T07_12335 [Steroidobacteraceae bacterium]